MSAGGFIGTIDGFMVCSAQSLTHGVSLLKGLMLEVRFYFVFQINAISVRIASLQGHLRLSYNICWGVCCK